MSGAVTPFFIVGPGRSGTSLLMAMLGAHPRMTVPPETHLLRNHVIGGGGLSPEEARKRLADDASFARCDVPAEALVSAREDPVRWGSVYRRFLRRVAEEGGTSLVGDKDPRAIEHLRVIHTLFPDATVFQMVRDPRDVYLSRLKAGWSTGRHWFWQAMPYRIHHGIGSRLGPELFEERFRRVVYEDLVRAPGEELKAITSLLGVTYDPEMLAYHENADDLVGDDERAWKENLGRPVISDNYGKWRGTLGKRELLRIEAVCRRVFAEGLYEASVTGPAMGERIERALVSAVAAGAETAYLTRLRAANALAIRRLQ